MNGSKQIDQSKGGDYRVLARKYRPADFTALVGQEPIVQTLINAFATSRIAQAWMLTGVRGVGKTTTARILARALNYKTANIDRPSVDLTIPGEHCQAIMEGRHVDVIEMDAASHTGIDDIRDIINRVRYAPVSARYKVYLIDEVHMLSTQAFNGLLKTLEEPPPHVKFIFATTEVRKVPLTVMSRCQRFDLRRIDASKLVGHLYNIARQEGIEVEDEALAMVARAAEGSARDSLSILDRAIAYGAGKVTAEAVRTMLGLADRACVIDLFENVMNGDVASVIDELMAQYEAGADPIAVLNDLAEFTHLVTRLRFVPSAAEDVSLSEDERKRGLVFAKSLSVRVLSRAWQMLLKGIPEVQSSNRPISAAEMVLIRLTHAADLPTLDEVLKSLGDATSKQPSGIPLNGGVSDDGDNGGQAASVVSQARRPVTDSGGKAMRLVETEPASVTSTVPQPQSERVDVVPVRSMTELANLAEANREMTFKALIRRAVRPVRIEAGHMEVSLTSDAPKTFLNDLTAKLKVWTGRHWLVSLSKEEGGPTLAEIEATKRDVALTDAKADPTVAAILARFPDAKITDVRLLTTPDTADTDIDIEMQLNSDIDIDNEDNQF